MEPELWGIRLLSRRYGKKAAEILEREHMRAMCAADPQLEFVEDPDGRWFGFRKVLAALGEDTE